LLGSVMFLFAAILGADHTTNPSPKSRLAFKVFTVIVALPILAIAAVGLYSLVLAERWLDALTTIVQLTILLASVLAIAFQECALTRRDTGRCAMKPRSAGHLHVRPHRSAHHRPFDKRN
jgi:small-conductance mechanosensitive channel